MSPMSNWMVGLLRVLILCYVEGFFWSTFFHVDLDQWICVLRFHGYDLILTFDLSWRFVICCWMLLCIAGHVEIFFVGWSIHAIEAMRCSCSALIYVFPLFHRNTRILRYPILNCIWVLFRHCSLKHFVVCCSFTNSRRSRSNYFSSETEVTSSLQCTSRFKVMVRTRVSPSCEMFDIRMRAFRINCFFSEVRFHAWQDVVSTESLCLRWLWTTLNWWDHHASFDT